MEIFKSHSSRFFQAHSIRQGCSTLICVGGYIISLWCPGGAAKKKESIEFVSGDKQRMGVCDSWCLLRAVSKGFSLICHHPLSDKPRRQAVPLVKCHTSAQRVGAHRTLLALLRLHVEELTLTTGKGWKTKAKLRNSYLKNKKTKNLWIYCTESLRPDPVELCTCWVCWESPPSILPQACHTLCTQSGNQTERGNDICEIHTAGSHIFKQVDKIHRRKIKWVMIGIKSN